MNCALAHPDPEERATVRERIPFGRSSERAADLAAEGLDLVDRIFRARDCLEADRASLWFVKTRLEEILRRHGG